MKRLVLELEDVDHKQLKTYCVKRGISMRKVLSEAVKKLISKKVATMAIVGLLCIAGRSLAVESETWQRTQIKGKNSAECQCSKDSQESVCIAYWQLKELMKDDSGVKVELNCYDK